MVHRGRTVFNYWHLITALVGSEWTSERIGRWLAGLAGPLQMRKWRQAREPFGIYGGSRQLHAIVAEPSSTYTGCRCQDRDMAPLSSPLSSLLRLWDGVRRASTFGKTLRGWRRDYAQLLSHPPGAANYAASVRSSSSHGGRDLTETLWSAYRQAKRRTEGTEHKSPGAPLQLPWPMFTDFLSVTWTLSLCRTCCCCLQPLIAPQKIKTICEKYSYLSNAAALKADLQM